MTERIRVLLADDHETVRQGLCALFAGMPEVEVIHDVKDGADAVTLARTSAPDLVIMDLSMPTGGIVAMRQIKEERPDTAMVVLSRHRDSAYVREAFAAGATGYVLKQSPFSELKRAVLTAARGERFVDAQLGVDPLSIRPPAPTTQPLSKREVDVLRLAAAGHSNKEVAATLNISVKTVEAHKSNAMRKLRLKDRAGLMRYGLTQGWLSDD